ncbi:unnamed protein product [Acanthoscelides obtectus]|uniref:LITAF domain-containing protein n=1 Tax=Acanthoscelides obtectus TaxID=200917 RepID=A0A9P0K7M8_ACAOB|nr:unnamed protein product [Acanthoscelides obtectus]CAK1622887.1 hypothetical protein AOBTE_LOCUS1709 [Acanthoscelides obtectus]
MPYEAIYVVLGPGPVVLTCPACNTRVTTYTRTAPNPMTHCLAACLCILGGTVRERSQFFWKILIGISKPATCFIKLFNWFR